MNAATPLLMVAGEASGDLHGARLLAELRELHPGVEAFGLGGGEMAAAGFDAVAHSREIAVVGITEALRILPRAWRIFRQLLAEVDRRGARTAVLIDSPDFNLRLAKKLHKRGVRVVYYISPQLWAWRQRRIRVVERVVEKMLVLFPFEADFYRRHEIDAVHVGHPLIDEIPVLPQAWDAVPPEDSDEETAPVERLTVSLLPGSRESEVRRLLPLLLRTARRIAQQAPVTFRLIEAAAIPEELFEEVIETTGVREIVLERVSTDRFLAVASSHLALCASGTATVEVGLLGTPLIVVYRMSSGSSAMARWLVDLKYASMVNLVLDRPALPEFLQGDATPEKIAAAAVELLRDQGAIERMRADLAELRERLGAEGGASRRAAEEVAKVLAGETKP